jgi:ribonuclease P protein component
MTNRLPKNIILKSKQEFNDLFTTGSFSYGAYSAIISKEATSFKIGFAITRKIRGSVNRNKLKRQLREIFRTHKFLFPLNKHLILYVKKKPDSFLDLKNDILAIIRDLTVC